MLFRFAKGLALYSDQPFVTEPFIVIAIAIHEYPSK